MSARPPWRSTSGAAMLEAKRRAADKLALDRLQMRLFQQRAIQLQLQQQQQQAHVVSRYAQFNPQRHRAASPTALADRLARLRVEQQDQTQLAHADTPGASAEAADEVESVAIVGDGEDPMAVSPQRDADARSRRSLSRRSSFVRTADEPSSTESRVRAALAHVTEPHAAAVFKQFATSGTMYVSYGRWDELCTSLSVSLQPEERAWLLRRLDRAGDGDVHFDKFAEFLRGDDAGLRRRSTSAAAASAPASRVKARWLAATSAAVMAAALGRHHEAAAPQPEQHQQQHQQQQQVADSAAATDAPATEARLPRTLSRFGSFARLPGRSQSAPAPILGDQEAVARAMADYGFNGVDAPHPMHQQLARRRVHTSRAEQLGLVEPSSAEQQHEAHLYDTSVAPPAFPFSASGDAATTALQHGLPVDLQLLATILRTHWTAATAAVGPGGASTAQLADSPAATAAAAAVAATGGAVYAAPGHLGLPAIDTEAASRGAAVWPTSEGGSAGTDASDSPGLTPNLLGDSPSAQAPMPPPMPPATTSARAIDTNLLMRLLAGGDVPQELADAAKPASPSPRQPLSRNASLNSMRSPRLAVDDSR
jgi:hypothetical protein